MAEAMDARAERDALARIERLLTGIDERIRDLPTAKEFGEVRGRIAQIPGSWQMLAIMAALVALTLAAVRYGPSLPPPAPAPAASVAPALPQPSRQ